MTSGTPDPLLDAGSEAEPAGPDVRTLVVGGLSRSLGWVLLLTGLGALVALVWGASQPNQYDSKAKLLLRVGAREMASSESMVGPQTEPRLSAPTMDDEIEMLSDVAIYEKVARTLGPSTILKPAHPARHDGPETPGFVRLLHEMQGRVFEALPGDHDCTGPSCPVCLRRATKVLVRNTTVVSEDGSNVIRISSVSTSPELAQLTVQALADAFIERHREQFSIQVLVERNRPKVEQAKHDRDEAAVAYLEHVNRTGVETGDLQSPTFVAELNALEDKLWDAKLLLAQLREQRRSFAERAQDPEVPLATFGPILMIPNEQYETLLEEKLSLVAQRRGTPAPSAERGQALESRIAEIDRSLSRMPTTVSRATQGRILLESGDPPVSVGLQDDEQSLELKVAALTERYQEKKAKADESRRQNLMVEQERKDLAANRDSAESRYAQMQERFSVLEALGAIDSEDANLSVLQAPTLEREKLGPQRLGLLLKGLFAGLLAGCVLAVARQKFDTRLRDPGQFERLHGLPVLGVVPRLATLRDLTQPSVAETG